MAVAQESSLTVNGTGSISKKAANGIASPELPDTQPQINDLASLDFFDGVTAVSRTGKSVQGRNAPELSVLNDAEHDWHRSIIVDEVMPNWYRPNPQVHAFPPSELVEDIDGQRRLSAEKLAYWDIKLSPCEEALLSVEPVFKLAGLGQMAVRFSEHGRWMTHSRLDHSIDVMDAAGRVANNLELDVYQVQLARLAGLLHDVGHIAFAHAGEAIVRSLDDDPNYDHDIRVVELLRHGELNELLRRFSQADGSELLPETDPNDAINPMDLVAILDESKGMSKETLRQMRERTDLSPSEQQELAYEMRRLELAHIRFIVKEVADRSYMRTDVSGTDFSPRVKEAFFSIYDAFEQSVRISPRDREFGEYKVYFKDLEPARRLMAVRDALFHDYSCSPQAEVATALLERGILEAIEHGREMLRSDPDADVLTMRRLLEVTDESALAYLPGRYREWFLDYQKSMGGCLEQFISPVIAYSRGALTDRGREYVLGSSDTGEIKSSQFMDDLKRLAGEHIPALQGHLDDLMLVATCDYSKKMSVRRMTMDGEFVSSQLKRSLPDDRRYLIVSVPSDGSAGVTPEGVEALQSLAVDLLHRPEFIKPSHAPMTHRIFGKLDAPLYFDTAASSVERTAQKDAASHAATGPNEAHSS